MCIGVDSATAESIFAKMDEVLEKGINKKRIIVRVGGIKELCSYWLVCNSTIWLQLCWHAL